MTSLDLEMARSKKPAICKRWTPHGEVKVDNEYCRQRCIDEVPSSIWTTIRHDLRQADTTIHLRIESESTRKHNNNVALHRTCNQSSRHFNNDTHKIPNSCTAAINGNTGTVYTADNCIHTLPADDPVTGPFWTVWLDREYNIHRITVHARTSPAANNLYRMKEVEVTVDSTSVYTFPTSQTPRTITDITPELTGGRLPIRGSSVKLSRNRRADDIFLNFCEVQVWGCKAGFYGPNCNTSCGHCAGSAACNTSSGHCTAGCQPGWEAPLCTYCSRDYYGRNSTGIAPCSMKCSEGCMDNPEKRVCHKRNGTCLQGCQSGRHGWMCDQQCGHCAEDGACHRDTGHCSKGCQDGWHRPLCNVCDQGRYGADCSQTCGRCADTTSCSNTTGHCPKCSPGFDPPLCQWCKAGFYGPNCNTPCGHCAGSAACDTSSGHCPAACNTSSGHCPAECQPGWEDPLCKDCSRDYYGRDSSGMALCSTKCSEGCVDTSKQRVCHDRDGTCLEGCKAGFYGTNCTTRCGHCAGSAACNTSSGHCPAGCQPGWEAPLCTDCSHEYYGRDSSGVALCSKKCSESCMNTSEQRVCHVENGTCLHGCQKGRYGGMCDQQCGQCAGDIDCHKDTGHCSGGCQEGWQNLWCNEQISGSAGVKTGTVVGIVLSILVVVILIALAFILYKKCLGTRDDVGKSSVTYQRDPFSDNAGSVDRRGAHGTAGENLNNNWANGGRPIVTIHPHLIAVEPTYGNVVAPTAAAGQSVEGAGITSSADPIYVNTTAGRGEQTPVPKRPERKMNPGPMKTALKEAAIAASDIDIEDEEEDVYTHAGLYARYCDASKTQSQLDAFQTYLLNCMAFPEELSRQFKTLQKGMLYPAEAGNLPANLPKNRFKKLAAYDKNRVVLRRPSKDSGTDYINASFIKGVRSDRDYIATQGPTPGTVDDLWLMVWQERVTQIIMVTNLVEQGKTKCEKYWPTLGQSVKYRHVTVTSESEQEKFDFLIRTFLVTAEGSSSRREVHQYHYLAWPDHGVPAATSLVYFWRYVNTHAKHSAPPLVHCSAGVGRTGTYIALDIACGRKSRGLDVLILGIVTELREQRSIMVQTEAQYKFLHEVVLEEYTSRGTLLTLSQLDSQFPSTIDPHTPNAVIDHQFQTLNQLKTWAKHDCTTALQAENRDKNRDLSVLPDENHLIFLDAYCKDRNQYINAVYMSSVAVKKGFLMTQLPLPDTKVDLWRLVDCRDVRIIVSLGAYDYQSLRNYASYWPQDLQQTVKAGKYTVCLDNATAITDNIIWYQLEVQSKDKTSTVRLLQYKDWTEELPPHTSDIMHFINLLRTEVSGVTSPVIVQCLNGATQSGLFCVLCDIISHIQEDEEVDVFSTVRYLHQVCPQALSTQMQYRYCYHVAQEYKESMKLYTNI